ncbi:MAG: hypothetical protein ABIR24_03780 [Verrucomicrobiota bacterium]
MASNTIPLAVPADLLQAIREAAHHTDLSQADVMRQSMKAGLPRLLEQFQAQHGLKPFTKEEARRAFGPDPEWDPIEQALARRQRRRSPKAE